LSVVQLGGSNCLLFSWVEVIVSCSAGWKQLSFVQLGGRNNLIYSRLSVFYTVHYVHMNIVLYSRVEYKVLSKKEGK
jgi:hypothetical protein